MTAITNRNVVIAASVIAAIFVGQSLSAASAQETAVDPADVSANVAQFTMQASTDFAVRLATPSYELEEKFAEVEDHSTIRPDYSDYASNDADTEDAIVVADAR